MEFSDIYNAMYAQMVGKSSGVVVGMIVTILARLLNVLLVNKVLDERAIRWVLRPTEVK